ncbi:MAG: glycoside hydrolase family 43 protein [Clostridiales bacterium]|nr:glycoside hydrolase family 43 protein [Clostridiales bacterium]
MKQLVNPILPGFYPDPSILRVEDDFYMITSTFSYYPGIPVFHSRDLRHWEQIGHVLDRPSQIPLDWRNISWGIYAPTLRFHNGLYYMITTNIGGGDNFVCTAEHPAGPWSEPHWIANAPGIDPTLFWDDDGACYMMATGHDEKGQGIWMSRFDDEKFCIVGERRIVWHGAMQNPWAPEAPHVYKKDGWYYLMIAEGGTEHYHSVNIARCKDIMGDYTGYQGNPIVTHRHLGDSYAICNVGHADLVQLKDGSWYMVLLGSRTYGGYHKNMGRETFIAPVDWSGDWPVVSPGTGRIEWTYPAPELPDFYVEKKDEDDFTSMVWNTLGTPVNHEYRVDGEKLYIRCQAKGVVPPVEAPQEPLPNGALGFYGRRQQHMHFSASVTATLPELPSATCGMTILQHDFAQIRIEMLHGEKGVTVRAVKQYMTGQWSTPDWRRVVEIKGETVIADATARLEILADGQEHHLICNGEEVAVINGGFLGSESCGGFVGAYIGCFASGNGVESNEEACFVNFSYKGIEEAL